MSGGHRRTGTIDTLKRIVKRTPIIRDLARNSMRRLAVRKAASFDSADYWESRYNEGRTSGAGSYNRLAHFKADVLNAFVDEHDVQSVIEFGSGDGSQLQLATYPRYIGVDVSRTAVAATRQRYAGDPSKSFFHSDELGPDHKGELSLSLDVVYHLVEDRVFERYMAQLFDAATRFVIVYSSNREGLGDSAHVRHRRFTDWIKKHRPAFRQIGVLTNPYPEDVRDLDNTSFADFYFFERASTTNHK